MHFNKKHVSVIFLIGVILSGILIGSNIIREKKGILSNDIWLLKGNTFRATDLAAVIYSLNVSSEYAPIGTSISISAKYLLDYGTPGDGFAIFSLKNSVGDIIQTKTNFTKGLVTWNTTFFLDPNSWSPGQRGDNASIELEVSVTDSTGEQTDYKTVFFIVIQSNITIVKETYEENITYGSVQEYKYTFLNSQNNSISITNHSFGWKIIDSENVTKVEGNNITDSTGKGFVVVNTSMLDVGRYFIKIYTNQSDDYKGVEYLQGINVLNQSTYLKCIIVTQDVYVLTNYTSKNTTIQIKVDYYGEENNTLNNFTVEWESSFSNGSVYYANSGVVLNITAPTSPGVYNITVSASKENYQIASRIVNVNILPRELNFSLNTESVDVGENYVIGIKISDIISNCSVTDTLLILYYELTISNSDYIVSGSLDTNRGYLNLTVKIPLKYSIYKWGTLEIVYNNTNEGSLIFEPCNISFELVLNTWRISQINTVNETEFNITRGTYIMFVLNLSSLEGISENISIVVYYLNTTIFNVTTSNFSAEEEIGPICSDAFEVGISSISIKIFAENVLIKQIDMLMSVFSQTALEIIVTISSS